MTIIKNIKLLFTSKSITSHFGKKPKKGGRPPNDNRGIKIIVFIKNLKLKEAKIWFKLKIFILLNKKITTIERKQ